MYLFKIIFLKSVTRGKCIYIDPIFAFALLQHVLEHFYHDHDYRTNRMKKYRNIFFIVHDLFGSTHSLLFFEKKNKAMSNFSRAFNVSFQDLDKHLR